MSEEDTMEINNKTIQEWQKKLNETHDLTSSIIEKVEEIVATYPTFDESIDKLHVYLEDRTIVIHTDAMINDVMLSRLKELGFNGFHICSEENRITAINLHYYEGE